MYTKEQMYQAFMAGAAASMDMDSPEKEFKKYMTKVKQVSCSGCEHYLGLSWEDTGACEVMHADVPKFYVCSKYKPNKY